ncbi:hypothetical protein [Nocardia sp. AG03]|uniref:hypothetical protein n=1 Tax=Nocardia sp. AG03 TaxID=3025312 RepID=UPI00241827D2|nr:hypothetical protein [Nocardia sp. AG03]
MTQRFRAELEHSGRPYVLLTGPPERRLAYAVAAVDDLLARGWGITDPLPEKR